MNHHKELLHKKVLYSDYKDVDGVKYPFTIKQTLGRQSFEFKVDSIKVNTGLADKNFEVEQK